MQRCLYLNESDSDDNFRSTNTSSCARLKKEDNAILEADTMRSIEIRL